MISLVTSHAVTPGEDLPTLGAFGGPPLGAGHQLARGCMGVLHAIPLSRRCLLLLALQLLLQHRGCLSWLQLDAWCLQEKDKAFTPTQEPPCTPAPRRFFQGSSIPWRSPVQPPAPSRTIPTASSTQPGDRANLSPGPSPSPALLPRWEQESQHSPTTCFSRPSPPTAPPGPATSHAKPPQDSPL